MSYATQATMAQDHDLTLRVAACAATQGAGGVLFWAKHNQWELSASPGWDAAYAYAVDTNVDRPGNQSTVISDAMILSAVQALIAQQTAAPSA